MGKKIPRTRIIFEGDFKTTTARMIREMLVKEGCKVMWTDSHELTVVYRSARKEVKDDGESSIF